MTGFGRTGKMFGFQHYDVQPDIVTFAKGISASWIPLSGVGCTTDIQASALALSASTLPAMLHAVCALLVCLHARCAENSRLCVQLIVAHHFSCVWPSVCCAPPFDCVDQDFFRVNPLGYGATYQAHPVALACGYEVVKYTIAEDIVSKVHALEAVLKEEMQRCACTLYTPHTCLSNG